MVNEIENLSLVSEITTDNLIGDILVEQGKLKTTDLHKIIQFQADKQLKFGDAAVQLGLVTDEDVNKALGLQFQYTYLSPAELNMAKSVVSAHAPFSQEAESIRALRSHLMQSWVEQGNQTLALVSGQQEENASALAANLAVSFAQLGKRTLLIDCNFRKPRQHEIFRLKETKGLSDILASRAGGEVISKINSMLFLHVLGAGTLPPNPQELLGRARFASLVEMLREQYDFILFDTPPTNEYADAQMVAAKAQGALLVAKTNLTKNAALKNMHHQLVGFGVEVIGVVLNDSDLS